MSKETDWVKAISTCTAKTLFRELRKVVDTDVISAKKNVCEGFILRSGAHHDTFSVNLYEDKQFVKKRVFELVNQEIRVHEKSTDSKAVLTGRASLTDANDCLIKVADKPPMELCEFSRLALENFFFSEL